MTESVEWCVMDPLSVEPHRGPMSEEAAREWVRASEKEYSIPRDTFYVACRVVGPWSKATGRVVGRW